MAAKKLTAERLRELLTYDPETGVFTRRVSRRGCSAGEVAGCLHSVGYFYVGVDRVKYPVHRLAWLYMTGSWPREEVDHINGVRSDNRWANLRAATKSQNMQNQRKSRGGTSKYLGVCRAHWGGKWLARIVANGKQKNIGIFQTEEEAHQAYVAAKRELHEFCTI